MTVELFLMGLAGLTFVAVLTFLLTSKKRIEDRLSDEDAPASSLAKDGDRHRAVD